MRWIGIYMDMGTSTDTVWMGKMEQGWTMDGIPGIMAFSVLGQH